MSNTKLELQNELALCFFIGVFGYGSLVSVLVYIFFHNKQQQLPFIILFLIVACSVILIVSFIKSIKLFRKIKTYNHE